MKRIAGKKLVFFLLFSLLAAFPQIVFAFPDEGRFVFDEAGLLTEAEKEQLEYMAQELGAERETEFLILTANDTEELDLSEYIGKFYDAQYGTVATNPAGTNAAILALDMENREVEVAVFYKAEEYLNAERRGYIIEQITPYLSEGDFYGAFSIYLQSVYEFMGTEPGESPETDPLLPDPVMIGQEEPSESIFFQWWFHVIVSLIVAGVAVALMAHHSGGRVTVHSATYLNQSTSRILNRSDNFIRKTVTKRKKPQNNSGGGGFGGGSIIGSGGGITKGGHSFSSTRGKF